MQGNPEQDEIAALLSGLVPIASGTLDWPGAMRLSFAAHATHRQPPPGLVTSVRCLVRVGSLVLVYEDRHPSTDVLPGGRCEAGESWAQTAQREVFEETGFRVDVATLSPLGFLHYRHLTPVPADHPYPNPDFFQVVLCGEAEGAPRDWADLDGWVTRAWLTSVEEALVLPLTAAGRAFLRQASESLPALRPEEA